MLVRVYAVKHPYAWLVLFQLYCNLATSNLLEICDMTSERNFISFEFELRYEKICSDYGDEYVMVVELRLVYLTRACGVLGMDQ